MGRSQERKRIKKIVATFLKHGFNDPAEVRGALEELGPTFVKIGQILSTRPDIIPESYILEFQKLQDDVKPEPFDAIKGIIEHELNGSIDELFLEFDDKPMASASIAQVHTAMLKGGSRVVVKVQRPFVKQTMMEDLVLLKKASRILKFRSQMSVIDPVQVVEELEYTFKEEMDFLNEANNIKEFYENNKDIKYITCPQVFDQYTTSNLLVMEYIDGIKIDRVDELVDEGYDIDDIATKLTQNYLKQIFEDGFFHGDPHPGNILISDKKIAYIDFGMMGELSRTNRDKFNEFLYGVATRNMNLITQSVLKIGIKKGRVDTRKFYSDIEQIYNNYIDMSLYSINIPEMLDEVMKACRNNNIALPRDITMMVKGILTIEGVISKLSPDTDVMSIIAPYIKTQMSKDKDYRQEILDYFEALYNFNKSGLKMPKKLLELINGILAGKLKIQMEHVNLEKNINDLNKMANRVVFGMIVSSLVIGSSIVINANAGPKIYGMPAIGLIGYLGAAVMGIWLLISIIRSGRM